jgi:hypothetical protein
MQNIAASIVAHLPSTAFKNLYFCRVKLLIVIFSLYVLLLPALPCSDPNECRETAATEAPVNDTGNHKQHDEEACSPFCNCSCCGQIFTPVLHLNRIAIVKQTAQKQQYFYQDISLSSDFLGTIWQPPKV